jgi:uncharacterized protein (UPF0264 family)
MRLLVSAASAADATAALEGGADIVDAKDPARGALGAVTPDVFHGIVGAVRGARPVTAALGDAMDEATIEAEARRFVAMGATLVKVGFDGVPSRELAVALARAAVRGAHAAPVGAGVVLVAYADITTNAVSPSALLEVASASGAAGVLLDTADKHGPRLTELASLAWLTAWVEQAHRRSLAVALAGRLRAGDMALVQRSGADVAGVRSAACSGGRDGLVEAVRVRGLRRACAAVELATQP